MQLVPEKMPKSVILQLVQINSHWFSKRMTPSRPCYKAHESRQSLSARRAWLSFNKFNCRIVSLQTAVWTVSLAQGVPKIPSIVHFDPKTWMIWMSLENSGWTIPNTRMPRKYQTGCMYIPRTFCSTCSLRFLTDPSGRPFPAVRHTTEGRCWDVGCRPHWRLGKGFQVVVIDSSTASLGFSTMRRCLQRKGPSHHVVYNYSVAFKIKIALALALALPFLARLRQNRRKPFKNLLYCCPIEKVYSNYHSFETVFICFLFPKFFRFFKLNPGLRRRCGCTLGPATSATSAAAADPSGASASEPALLGGAEAKAEASEGASSWPRLDGLNWGETIHWWVLWWTDLKQIIINLEFGSCFFVKLSEWFGPLFLRAGRRQSWFPAVSVSVVVLCCCPN